MTDHTTQLTRVPSGTDGYLWWSVASAVAGTPTPFAAPKASVFGIGTGAGAEMGNASARVSSVSIAA